MYLQKRQNESLPKYWQAVMLFYIQCSWIFSIMKQIKLFQSVPKFVQLQVYWLQVIIECPYSEILMNIAAPQIK
jgi:hypothetical protein